MPVVGWGVAVARRADEAATFAHRLRRQLAVDHHEIEPTVVLHRPGRAPAVGFVNQLCPRDISLQHMSVGVDNAHDLRSCLRLTFRWCFTPIKNYRSSSRECKSAEENVAAVNGSEAP
jgi:hypothetical protein